MRAVNGFIFYLFVLFGLTSSAFGETNVEKSIVRIRSGTKYSTGFFWQDGKTVVTSLHAIGNSNDIEICLSGTTNWYPATLSKVHKLSDLVMLTIANYNSPYFLLEKYASKPDFHTKCFTVGYNSGSSNYISREFTVGLSEKNNLKAVLPNALWAEVNSWGFLSLSTEIVYIEGQLLHGFSGAPIVDTQGKLVGVADGGLENGAAGISWCVSANYLTNLKNSTEGLAVLNQNKIKNLFASEEYENREIGADYVYLNGFKFRKVKTRTFSQLDNTGKYSTYDGWGLVQLLNNFSGFNYASFKYDIYMEESSGATIVVPANEELMIEDGQIVAGSDKVKIYANIVRTENMQQSSVIFEQTVMPNYMTNWIADPMWTYPAPYFGPNNSVIRRRAYYGNNNANYLFEALAGKGNYFLGVAAKRNNFSMINQSDVEEWAKYAIAIQLTAFTN